MNNLLDMYHYFRRDSPTALNERAVGLPLCGIFEISHRLLCDQSKFSSFGLNYRLSLCSGRKTMFSGGLKLVECDVNPLFRSTNASYFSTLDSFTSEHYEMPVDTPHVFHEFSGKGLSI